MTDVWDRYLNTNEFKRVLDQLGALPDDAEGDDVTTGNFAIGGFSVPCRIEPESTINNNDQNVEPDIRHRYWKQQEAEERIAQIARNVYASMQEHARDNIELSHVLHDIDRACDMVRHTHMSKASAANAIWPQVREFAQTPVWREFKRAVERVAGFEHHPIALLTDLIQAALDDHDDL